MTAITESIDVKVPVERAYGQWSLFTTFPRFMHGVDSVDVLPDGTTHWTISIGGVTREFDAKTLEREPNRRIMWTSISGPRHAGIVEFDKLGESTTRVTANLDIDPEGFVENAADKLGALQLTVKGDMERFKHYIEDEPEETQPEPELPGNWPPLL